MRTSRRAELMEKYGWEGISAGIRLQPTPHHKGVAWLDTIDQHFLQLWLDTLAGGMYSWGVLDDKTRVLTMVGNCIALGEHEQGETHIRGALILGATPREVLEVLLRTTLYVGMPGGAGVSNEQLDPRELIEKFPTSWAVRPWRAEIEP